MRKEAVHQFHPPADAELAVNIGGCLFDGSLADSAIPRDAAQRMPMAELSGDFKLARSQLSADLFQSVDRALPKSHEKLAAALTGGFAGGTKIAFSIERLMNLRFPRGECVQVRGQIPEQFGSISAVDDPLKGGVANQWNLTAGIRRVIQGDSGSGKLFCGVGACAGKLHPVVSLGGDGAQGQKDLTVPVAERDDGHQHMVNLFAPERDIGRLKSAVGEQGEIKQKTALVKKGGLKKLFQRFPLGYP